MTNGEIAEKLNISPATLSLIINNKGGVSDGTRARVLNELKNMGYEHLLKKADSKADRNLSFVVYKKEDSILGKNASYIFLIEGIEKAVSKRGYNLFLNIINEGENVEQQVERIAKMNSEGVILYATEMQEKDMEVFRDYPKPIVVIDNDFIKQNYTCVYSNYMLAGDQVISYLADMGHRRIGYLRCKKRLRCFEIREYGYRRAMEEYGMEFSEEDIWDVDLSSDENMYRSMQELVEAHREDLPTAFVTDEDVIAVTAIRIFEEAGIRVPEDVSVVGYNNSPIAQKSVPALTTICGLDMEYLYKAVSELIFEVRHNSERQDKYGCKIMIGTSLVERESVRRIHD